MSIRGLTIFDCCPWCLTELRRGVSADNICGHENLLLADGHKMPADYDTENPNWREHQKFTLDEARRLLGRPQPTESTNER
jgi:hypothetical protein